MAVFVVELDTLPRIAAGGDMVGRARELKAKRAGHGASLAGEQGCQDLTPLLLFDPLLLLINHLGGVS